MPSMQLKYPFPKNPDDFESLCLRLYRKHWNVPNLQIHGRRGQRQSGADLLGTDDKGRICLVQCKQRDFDRTLSAQEVCHEVEAVKKINLKVERFAVATTAKRDGKLQRMVAQITRDHATQGLFSVEIHSWDDLNEILNEHPDIADPIYRRFPSGERTEPTEGPRQSRQSPVNEPSLPQLAAPLAADEPTDIHSEIDEAGSYLEKGDLTVAEILFDRIQKRQGGRFTPRCWYRVFANQGHICRLRGEFAEAGRLYLQAKEHQPQDPAARWLEGLAFALTDDMQKAGVLADRLVSDHPTFPKGWALFVTTRPEGAPLDRIESSIPELIREDAEVALNLASRAAAQEKWAESERFARGAIRASPNWQDAKVQLAIALISKGQAEVLRSRVCQATGNVQAPIEEARDLLQQAIDSAPRFAPVGHLALLRLNQAVAQELLGLSDEFRDSIVKGGAKPWRGAGGAIS